MSIGAARSVELSSAVLLGTGAVGKSISSSHACVLAGVSTRDSVSNLQHSYKRMLSDARCLTAGKQRSDLYNCAAYKDDLVVEIFGFKTLIRKAQQEAGYFLPELAPRFNSKDDS